MVLYGPPRHEGKENLMQTMRNCCAPAYISSTYIILLGGDFSQLVSMMFYTRPALPIGCVADREEGSGSLMMPQETRFDRRQKMFNKKRRTDHVMEIVSGPLKRVMAGSLSSGKGQDSIISLYPSRTHY